MTKKSVSKTRYPNDDVRHWEHAVILWAHRYANRCYGGRNALTVNHRKFSVVINNQAETVDDVLQELRITVFRAIRYYYAKPNPFALSTIIFRQLDQQIYRMTRKIYSKKRGEVLMVDTPNLNHILYGENIEIDDQRAV